MGAKSSKPLPIRVDSEATGVETFQEDSKYLHQKAGAPGEVRSLNQEANDDQQAAAIEKKLKKKRQRIKKDKCKLPTLMLLRAHTQLNELKNAKPQLQQSPQVRQQHTEVQDAHALDKEITKAPSRPDGRSKFFDFESWRILPQMSTYKNGTKTVILPVPMTRSQSCEVERLDYQSTLNEIDDLKTSQDMNDVDIFSPSPIQKTKSIMTTRITATPTFMSDFNQVELVRPDFQATPLIRVKISEQRTSKEMRQSRSSDLHLDDVDDDLMQHMQDRHFANN